MPLCEATFDVAVEPLELVEPVEARKFQLRLLGLIAPIRIIHERLRVLPARIVEALTVSPAEPSKPLEMHARNQ